MARIGMMVGGVTVAAFTVFRAVFMFSMSMTLVLIGAVVALVLVTCLSLTAVDVAGDAIGRAVGRCGVCGGRMDRGGVVRFCPRCDRLPATGGLRSIDNTM